MEITEFENVMHTLQISGKNLNFTEGRKIHSIYNKNYIHLSFKGRNRKLLLKILIKQLTET